MKLLALLLASLTIRGFAQDTIYKSDLVPSHLDTIQKATPWQAATQDGIYMTSRQNLRLKVRLTKAALKRHGS
jgi:hypothetical protein